MINSSQFIIQATEDLGDFYGWNILSGDYLTVDPLSKPKNRELVLIGDEITKFVGQQIVNGVVVYVGRPKTRQTESMIVEVYHD